MSENRTTAMTARQKEQFDLGYAFHDGGFPRCAPHEESEWCHWLMGWDAAWNASFERQWTS